MRIGFLAPMKAPNHPVPSGDRQMARQVMAALRLAGHDVTLLSTLRSYAATPEDPPLARSVDRADAEIARLSRAWGNGAPRPDLLFTYHLYYKAPDLVGPRLALAFGIPYVTAEASLAERRAVGPWAARQALVADAVRLAVLNICFTSRDRDGLAGTATPDSLVVLPPFIDTAPFAAPIARPPRQAPRLITVAMMRPGDKLHSYRLLGEALSRLLHRDWTLGVIGDGAARAAVHDALAPLGPARVRWLGAVLSDAVPCHLAEADLLVWPGFNEAFGLCYLEAQASGLPVVAVRNAGTPSVIRHGETGLLTEGDAGSFAAAIERLLVDPDWRRGLGQGAYAFVHGTRGLPAASVILNAAITARWGGRTAA